jgi:hypothetical protein
VRAEQLVSLPRAVLLYTFPLGPSTRRSLRALRIRSTSGATWPSVLRSLDRLPCAHVPFPCASLSDSIAPVFPKQQQRVRPYALQSARVP